MRRDATDPVRLRGGGRPRPGGPETFDWSHALQELADGRPVCRPVQRLVAGVPRRSLRTLWPPGSTAPNALTAEDQPIVTADMLSNEWRLAVRRNP